MSQIRVTFEDVLGDDLSPVKDAKVSFDNDETVEPYSWCDVSVGNLHREQPILTERQRGLIKYLVRGMTTAEYDDLVNALLTTDDPQRIKTLLWRFRKTPIHAAPFGHCYLKFTVEAPVFVARQLVKHKFLRMSEVSRRYVSGKPEYYVPDNWASIAAQVKQGAGEPLQCDANDGAMTLAYHAIDTSDRIYEQMLKTVAPEEARMVLPLCHMTRWRWSGSLDAMMDMCVLRLDDHAQSQSREVARLIGEYVKRLFPQSWASYVEGDV